MRGLFVTATDTGVGKTAVAAALAHALRARGIDVGVAKPVQSGGLADDPDGDAMLLREASGVEDPLELVCPYAFAAPLAPLVAARGEGRTVERVQVLSALEALAARHDVVVVEGAGGLLVPVGEDWTIADLVTWTGLPALVVARPGLGTVNHTLLTLAELRRRGIPLAGVVLNGTGREADASEQTNAALIERLGGVEPVVSTPWLDVRPHELPKALAGQPALERLAALESLRPPAVGSARGG